MTPVGARDTMKWKRRFDLDNLSEYRVDSVDNVSSPTVSLVDYLEIMYIYKKLQTKLTKMKHTTNSRPDQQVAYNRLLNLFSRVQATCSQYDNAICETKLLYNSRPFIVTPPIYEITPQYLAALKNIYKTEEIQRSIASSSSVPSSVAAAGHRTDEVDKFVPRSTSKRKSNPKNLYYIYNKLRDAELKTGSLKKQMQGGDSFMRQRVLPPLCRNTIRGVVLSDESLPLDVIALPRKFESLLCVTPTMLVIKRDPVLREILTFTKFQFHDEGFHFKLHSVHYRMINLDLDGDTITCHIVNSVECIAECMLQASPRLRPYRHFGHTVITFNQPHTMLAQRHEEFLLTNIEPVWTRQIFAESKRFYSTMFDRLHGVALTLASICGLASKHPTAAFDFIQSVCRLVYEADPFDIQPLNKLDINTSTSSTFKCIFESGTKGDAVLAQTMLTKIPQNNCSMAIDILKQHNKLIGANGRVSSEFYQFFLIAQSLQNIVINSAGCIIYYKGVCEYNLGHISTYLAGSTMFSDFTIFCIDNELVKV